MMGLITPFRKKTFIAILVVLFFSGFVIWCNGLPTGTGNYIPKTLSENQGSSAHGAVIMVTYNETGILNNDGSSPLHYIRTFVGDTGLRFDANASANDSKRYNQSMIAAVITCFNDSTLEMSITTDSITHGYYGYTNTYYNQYHIPCLCVIVRVSGFSNNHNDASTNFEDWLEDTNSSCTYTVAAILDSNDSGNRSAYGLSLNSGECFHVVMVPFSHSNTTYWEGANPYASGSGNSDGRYAARYTPIDFSYTYENSSGNTTSGTATDSFSLFGTITSPPSTYRELSLSTSSLSSYLSLSQMLENSVSSVNLATNISMSYAKYTTGNSISTDTLHVSLHPYNDMSEYYFLRSGTSTATANRYFTSYIKLTNISSSNGTSPIFEYIEDSTTKTAEGTSFDSKDYGSEIGFKITTTTSSLSGTYKKKTSASLSFDVYPYIPSIPASIMGGDYSMNIVVAFSIE